MQFDSTVVKKKKEIYIYMATPELQQVILGLVRNQDCSIKRINVTEADQ